MTKLTLMRDPANEWHFIGHLQTNKVKHIPGNFAWLHTLDSLKLARKLFMGEHKMVFRVLRSMQDAYYKSD